MSDLIYDIGLHEGEDSEFYLLKGFRVVAVDADWRLCDLASGRLRPFVESGQLTILNVAIAETAGRVTFFRNPTVPAWGTIMPGWSRQNAERGSPSEQTVVEAITLADLVARHGDAFYMKIDIEGMDRLALSSLKTTRLRPRYMSIETAFPRDPTLRNLRAEFQVLSALGYDRFKIVPQHEVVNQVPPSPPLAGKYVPYRFGDGSSGLFGEETPGDWLTLEQALARFTRIRRKNWLQAQLHRKMILHTYYCEILRRLTGTVPSIGWYDIHAKHSAAG